MDRDAAAMLNMLWKITPEGDVKAVLRKGIVPREALGKANTFTPRPIVHVVWASLKALKAGDKRPGPPEEVGR
jgi:hypothetical protein